MKKYLKITLLVVIAIILVGTFVFLYQKSKPKVITYEIVKPEVTDLQKTTVATGKVEPRDEILIKPQISGIIDEVYKLISREEYEKSEVALKQAREERQTAKDNLEIVKEGITKNSASFSSTMIRSTIDGLILDVPVKAGNSVIMSNTFNDGTTIATVANMNDMIFRGNIDETEVGRIHEQMPIKLTIGALQNLTFNAILEYISPKGVETNGANQFEIKAAITIPDSVQIRSGYSANAEIVLQRANQVLAVPESTIEFNGDSTFVYIMTDSVPEQKFQRTQVTAGMSDGIKIEIKKGITAQDKIRGAEKKDK